MRRALPGSRQHNQSSPSPALQTRSSEHRPKVFVALAPHSLQGEMCGLVSSTAVQARRSDGATRLLSQMRCWQRSERSAWRLNCVARAHPTAPALSLAPQVISGIAEHLLTRRTGSATQLLEYSESSGGLPGPIRSDARAALQQRSSVAESVDPTHGCVSRTFPPGPAPCLRFAEFD